MGIMDKPDTHDEPRCARCHKPLIDCPGEAKRLPSGQVVCEPCTVAIAISGLDAISHGRICD